MQEYIRSTDLIVFDIDGVLIDTATSFIATIVTTAQYYINHMLNVPADLNKLSENDAMKFKQYSGFNNDWDLTAGMTAYLLFKYRNSHKPLDLDDFLTAVDGNGGGLEGIEKYIAENTDTKTYEWIYERVDYKTIQSTFQEFYAGDAYCESLYGFSPRIHSGPGSIETEVILLDKDILDRWDEKIGILTGRMKNETMLGIKMLGLEDIDLDLVEYTDHVLPDKPHPAKMERILEKAGSSAALFIGDSIDDFLTVVNYNKLDTDRQLRFGLISSDGGNFPEKAQAFRAESVNDMLSFIYLVKYL